MSDLILGKRFSRLSQWPVFFLGGAGGREEITFEAKCMRLCGRCNYLTVPAFDERLWCFGIVFWVIIFFLHGGGFKLTYKMFLYSSEFLFLLPPCLTSSLKISEPIRSHLCQSMKQHSQVRLHVCDHKWILFINFVSIISVVGHTEAMKTQHSVTWSNDKRWFQTKLVILWSVFSECGNQIWNVDLLSRIHILKAKLLEVCLLFQCFWKASEHITIKSS